jgi:hypothetical protein
MLYSYIMLSYIEFPPPIDEQLKDIALQIEVLTHYPEQVFVYESETTISGMVQALQTKREALLEHQLLIDEYDVVAQDVPDTRAEVNV